LIQSYSSVHLNFLCVLHMNDSSNEIVKQLIRLANDRNLDAGSRNKICDMAQHVRDLQNLLNKTRELNIKLEKFKCANKLNQIN